MSRLSNIPSLHTAISAACLVGWDTGGMDWDAPENWA